MKTLFLVAITASAFATMRPLPHEIDDGQPRPTLYATVEISPGGSTYTIAPDGCYGGV